MSTSISRASDTGFVGMTSFVIQKNSKAMIIASLKALKTNRDINIFYGGSLLRNDVENRKQYTQNDGEILLCVDSSGNRLFSGKEKLKGEYILRSTSKEKLVPRHVTKGEDNPGKTFSRFPSIFDVINTHPYSKTTSNIYVQPSFPLHRKYM